MATLPFVSHPANCSTLLWPQLQRSCSRSSWRFGGQTVSSCQRHAEASSLFRHLFGRVDVKLYSLVHLRVASWRLSTAKMDGTASEVEHPASVMIRTQAGLRRRGRKETRRKIVNHVSREHSTSNAALSTLL